MLHQSLALKIAVNVFHCYIFMVLVAEVKAIGIFSHVDAPILLGDSFCEHVLMFLYPFFSILLGGTAEWQVVVPVDQFCSWLRDKCHILISIRAQSHERDNPISTKNPFEKFI